MAMTLADVRAKYPQYKDVDDQALADAIYNKHYAGKDRREFDARVGLKPYQNFGEAIGTAVGNIPAGVERSKYLLGEMIADTASQAIDPRQQMGFTPPLKVEPGAPVADLLAQPAAMEIPAAGPGNLLPKDMQRALGRKAAEVSLSQQLRRAAPDAALQANALDVAPGSLEEGVAGGVAGAVEMAAPMAASILVRNPAPLVTYFTARTAGDTYGTAKETGAPYNQAIAGAALNAAAEAATEALAGKVFLDGGKTLVGSVLKGVGTEALTEGATEALQALVDSGVLGVDMTLTDALNRVKTATIAGGIAGGIVSPITHVARGPGEPEVSPAMVTAPEPEPDAPIEDRVALPGPQTMLALPSPEQFKAPELPRRQPAPPRREEPKPPTEDEIDYQSRVALQRTRQQETAELLQTARETITPLGTFDIKDVDTLAAPAPETRTQNGQVQVKHGRNGKWHNATMTPDGQIVSPGADADMRAEQQSIAQRIRAHRVRTGRPVEAPITIEEMARAKVPQRQIDAVIAARRPMTNGGALTALDIMRTADAKNIIPTDSNFAELALRTTGQRNVQRMTQAQLNALKTTLDAMPAHATPVTVPLAEQSPFTDEMYGKAVDAIRQQGRYTAAAIKDATGLKTVKDVDAVRDAMVRRGQLIERGKGDYRLYDTLGVERQTVPEDLPPGAFKEYTMRRVPVSKVRVTRDGKSAGTFSSAAEARAEVSKIRAKDKAAGVKIEPAEETAWGVMENRYDEQGNLLGSVVVDSHRDEVAAQKALEQLNAPPDTGARYTQTAVAPNLSTDPAAPARPRAPMPAPFAGRLPEIVKRLNAQARERKLPLLGVRVQIKPNLTAPEGEAVEGFYLRKLISLTAQNLTPEMSTDQIVEKLGQVMDHELIHALRAADVLGPETDGWKTIVRYAKRAKRPGSTESYLDWARRNYANVPGYETNDSIEEEAIAEAFRAWASNRRNVTGKPATVFRQLVEWFKRLINTVPQEAFMAIESGQMVLDALRPPGGDLPRAKATRQMEAAATGVSEAQQAKDENLVRVRSREYLRAREQARDDRFGRSGPKTVLGTTPSKTYNVGEVGDVALARSFADTYRQQNGVSGERPMTLLPVDANYMKRVADAQAKGQHSPGDPAVAKAYRALIDETRHMFQALGPIEVTAWDGNGAPYASPAAMLGDIAAGKLTLRLSDEMFGPGADNPGHPLNTASGLKTTDDRVLTNNDLLRIVHDVYGHGQSGFRDDARGAYNAYHEHARLLSPEARQALATETLGQRAWQEFGQHLRRRDGTVPRETDVDYLPPNQKEFAEQKAFLIDEDLISADPGWAMAEKASGVEETPRFMVGYHGTPHKVDRFSKDKIGTGEGAQAYGYGLYFTSKKEVADHYRQALSYKSTVKEFRDALPDDADFDEVMDLIGTGRFTPYQERLLKALNADGWLGFDYPSQAISAAYSKNVANWDPSQELLDAVAGTGNLYKVDLPEDNELMNWNATLGAQPTGVRAKLESFGLDMGQLAADLFEGDAADLTGEMIYEAIAAQVAPSADGSGNPAAASAALAAAGIPGHTYTGKDSGAKNYVIYDDSRIQILEENPKFSRFDEDLPGGRLYGNPDRSPGGALSKPDTPTPAFTNARPANRFFGGEMAEHQLQMVRTGERGATMIYLNPEDYLALADTPENPEQGTFDAAIAQGFKFSTLPSLVIDGYAGNVRAVAADGAYAGRALAAGGDAIPVVLYPKKGESLGLVTALEAPDGSRVPWPRDGRQENFPEVRGPRYSVGSEEFRRWFGNSAVVNADGSPKVVFHGSPTRFTAFDKSKIGTSTDTGDIGAGFYFTPNFMHAQVYGADEDGVQRSENVARVFLSIQNPLREFTPDFMAAVDQRVGAQQMPAETNSWTSVGSSPEGFAAQARSQAITAEALARGYDGVWMNNPRFGYEELVAFEPAQIKSAVNNNGQYDATNPDIRYSINAPFGERVPDTEPGPMRNIVRQRVDGWVGRALQNIGRNKRSLPVVGSIFDARVKLQDKMLSIKEMIEQIGDAGGNIDDLNDTYMLEQLYHGKVFDQIQQREQDLQVPLLEALKAAYDGPNKVTPADFEDYLYARHAPERNAYLRARGATDPNPSGMSDAEASAILDRLAIDGKLPDVEALAAMADAITADTTRTRVEAGLISEEAAASSPYQYYVPLRGFAEEDLDPGNPSENQTRARSGKGFSVGGREDRTVTGRGRKAGDVLGHLFLQNTEAVIRAQKNEVAMSFMRLLQQNENLGFGSILKTAPTRRVVGANGMIHEAGDPSYRQSPDIVTAKWKGKEVIARVSDPRLARAIKSDYISSSSDLVAALNEMTRKLKFPAAWNRIQAAVNTGWNPIFLLTNFIRDFQTASILAEQYGIQDLGKNIRGNAFKAMGGIKEVLREGTENSEWAQAFREMQRAGGTTEFLGINDLEAQIERIRKSVTSAGVSPTLRQVQNYLGHVGKFVGDYNKIAENAFRLAAYKAAKDSGASTSQAAFLAKNLTVNFNKGGELKPFMNGWWLFYNASTQGSAVLLNGIKNKRVRRIMYAVTAGGVAMDIINRALSGDDDENGVTDYDDVPDHVLQNNFVMMDWLGLLPKSKTGGMSYFSFPMPYGFNAFYNTGRNMSAAVSGSPAFGATIPERIANRSLDSMLAFADAFNPLGGVQDVLNFIAPTIADPFVDLRITNKDFSGATIVPERPSFGVPVPDSQKYWSNTGDIPVWVAEHLNRLTGGNEVRKGWMDVSPETLQYGFDYVLGGVGRLTGKAYDVGAKVVAGDTEDLEISAIPLANRFAGSVSSRNNTERYYDIAKEVETIKEELKMFSETGRIDEARYTAAQNPVEVSLIGMFEDAQKALGELRKKRKEVEALDTMPDKQKREIVRQIKAQQDEIMRRANTIYFQQKKAMIER